MSDLFGTWKVVVKTSGLKPQPAPEYLVLMDDSIYVLGVDSIGSSLPGVSTGRWNVAADGNLVLFPSDRFVQTRFYKPSGDKRYRYIGTKLDMIKKPVHKLELDLYLEKYSNGEER